MAVDYESKARQLHAALKRIAGYTPAGKLRRQSMKLYGLDDCEALEYAYDNVLQEAKQALKAVRLPAPKEAALGTPCKVCKGIGDHKLQCPERRDGQMKLTARMRTQALPDLINDEIAAAARPLYTSDEVAAMALGGDLRTARAVIAALHKKGTT